MTKEQAIDKIKKCLELANDQANEHEAKSALLMAQKLMAKYNVNIDVTDLEEKIVYTKEECVHRYDAAYRKPLAQIIADNFRCKFYLTGKTITFFGRDFDARVAKEAFEYAYEFAMKEGNKLENKAYKERGTAKGVHSSYTAGFLAGLKEALGKQCTALMIITPKDVIEQFDEMSSGWDTARGGFRLGRNVDVNAYRQGEQDGRTVMNGRRVENVK